ncbi:39S ribosomal protein L43, mitochondrial-like [Oppia nitens]|uniref:39S ribosomal protein L43, mitochondrial-like n=1 Tax=Oppia nitens TaxID=1686743 RepID=UPI0023DB8334|nr:39S ribosomal protein L43, mitochondrial-like [Oppia nitens]
MPKILDLSKFSLDRFIVHNPALPETYIRNAYYNGIGRFVCQLQRITFKFCKTNMDSRGVRHFIESQLVDWSRANPGVVVYLKPRRHRSPVIVTEYMNGMNHWMSVKKFSAVELGWWVDFLKNRSGYELAQHLSPHTSILPSVQGPWNPFINRPTHLNIQQFPNQERGQFVEPKPSATQQLIDMANDLNNK